MPDTCCGSEWRAGYAAGEVVQRIRPKYNADYLHNPHKGTATFQRFEGDPIAPDLNWHDWAGPLEFSEAKFPAQGPLLNDRYPRTTVSYCRWPWSVLEPEQGKIRFDLVDKALDAAARPATAAPSAARPSRLVPCDAEASPPRSPAPGN